MLSTKVIREAGSKIGAPYTFSSGMATTATAPKRNTESLYRRLRNKRDLRPPEAPASEVDWWTLPNDYLGNQHELNWAINSHGITPRELAFRNLHTRGLLMRATGKLDSNKALILNVAEEEDQGHATYVVSEKPINNAQTLTKQQFSNVWKEFKELMNYRTSLFVNDGALGSHPLTERKVRVVSDSAAHSLYLSRVLPRVPLVQPIQFKPAAVFLSCTNAGAKFAPQGFTIINPQTGTTIIGGAQSTKAFRNAFLTTAANEFIKSDVLALQSDSVVRNGATTLIISPDNLVVKNGWVKDLYGTDCHLWGNYGVSRLLDGATWPSKTVTPGYGDLIENLTGKSGNTQRVTQRLNAPNNMTSAPSNVVIVIADSSDAFPPLAKLSAAQARVHFAVGYVGGDKSPLRSLYGDAILTEDLALFVDKWDRLLAANPNTNVFVVNTKAKQGSLKNEEISAIINAVVDGKAAKAPTKANDTLKLSAVTGISGLSLDHSPNAGGVTTVTDQINKRVAALNTTFPNLKL